MNRKRQVRRDRASILLLLWLAVALLALASPALAQTFGATAALNPNAGSDTGSDSGPHVVSDGDGSWLAVWTSSEDTGGAGSDFDIFYSKSSDDGATWTSVALLNSNATTDSGNDLSPRAASNGNGRWVVVWQSNEDLGSTAGTDDDIFYAYSVDGGATWSAVATLNSNADTDGSASDTHPSSISDGSAVGWIAVWESDSTLGATIGSDLDILVAWSSDKGASWFSVSALNTNAGSDTGDDANAALASDLEGNLVVVWDSDEDVGSSLGTDFDTLVSRSADTGQTWTAPAALNTNAATDSAFDLRPQIACDWNGTWLAVWSSTNSLGSTIGDDLDILMARSIDAGASWTSPAVVNSNAPTDTITQQDNDPYVAGDGAGNWVVTWFTNADIAGLGTDFDILQATSDDDGATWTAFAALNSNATTDSLDDANGRPATDRFGNWITAWDSYDDLGGTVGTDRDIHLSLGTGPDADNDTLADGAEVNIYGSDPGLSDTDSDSFGDAAEAAAGSNPDDSKSTPLNSVAFDSPAALNSNAGSDSGIEQYWDLATDGTGTWIAAWASTSDVGGSGTDTDILISRSTDDGETWSSVSVLNSYAGSDSDIDVHPEVAGDGEGNWVIAWTSLYDLGGSLGNDGDVLVVTSDDNGVTWSSEAALHASAATDTSESETIHDLIYDGQGTWVALLTSTNDFGGTIETDTDPLVAISFDDGASWGAPIAVNSDAASDGSDDVVPRFAYDGILGWIVVWHRWDLISSKYNIMTASALLGPSAWGTLSTLNSNVDTGDNSNPQIATDGDGNWIAVWRSTDDMSGTIGSDADILYSVSTDYGANWTSVAALNSDAATDTREDSAPRIHSDAAGNWIASYTGYESHSADDGATWTDTTPLFPEYAATHPVGAGDLILQSDLAGNWVAVWGSTDSFSGTLGTDGDLLFTTGWGPDRDGDGYADADEVNTYGSNPDDAGGVPQPKIAWNTTAALNTNAGSDGPHNEVRVRVAYANGTWIAVWASQEDLSGTIDNDWDILFSTSDDDGVTWSAPAALNNNAATDTGDDEDPSILSGVGGFHVVWSSTEDLGSAIGSDFDVFYAYSSDDGASWSAPAYINSNATTDSGADIHARIGGNGLDILVVWYSNDTLGSTIGGDYDILRTYSENFGSSWATVAALNSFASADAHSDAEPEIAYGGPFGGEFSVVWYSTYPVGSTGSDFDILIAHSSDSGDSWTTAVGLNATMSSDSASDDDESPDIAYDGDQGWMVVWRSNNDLDGTIGTDYDILFSISTDDATTWSDSAALNTNAATASAGSLFFPQIDSTSPGTGVWIATWHSDTDVTGTIGTDLDILEAHTLDDGAHWTAPAPLNDNADTDSGFDRFPELAKDDLGNWMAVWISGDTLGATVGTDPDVFFSAGWGPDLDGDGIADVREQGITSDPRDYDSDDDGWDDGFEYTFGTSIVDADHDGDGACDGPGTGGGVCAAGPDNCPFVGNPGQANSDALFEGDDCQCGDVSDNGIVDAADVTAAQQNLVGATVSGTPDFSKCNVVGPVDRTPPHDDCTLQDIFRIQRYVQGGGSEPELIQNECTAYIYGSP